MKLSKTLLQLFKILIATINEGIWCIGFHKTITNNNSQFKGQQFHNIQPPVELILEN